MRSNQRPKLCHATENSKPLKQPLVDQMIGSFVAFGAQLDQLGPVAPPCWPNACKWLLPWVQGKAHHGLRASAAGPRSVHANPDVITGHHDSALFAIHGQRTSRNCTLHASGTWDLQIEFSSSSSKHYIMATIFSPLPTPQQAE